MAESQWLRSNEWVVQIEKLLDGDKNLADVKLMRVATAVRKKKPDSYIPQFLCLGPLHHRQLEKDVDHSFVCPLHRRELQEKDIGNGHNFVCPLQCREMEKNSFVGRAKISIAESFKGKSVGKISEKLRDSDKRFLDIVEKIKGIQKRIEDFYDCRPTDTEEPDQYAKNLDQYAKNFALMMAVDSSFLLSFLFKLIRFHDLFQPSDGPSHDSPSFDEDILRLCGMHHARICKCDIVKLENQIPLFVLKEVFKHVKINFSTDPGKDLDFNQLLVKTCKEFSPFRTPENVAENDKYDVGHGWIQFKAAPNKITFDKHTGTLYLPQIVISELSTEVLLRNMLALEANVYATSHDPAMPVNRYVALMNCLIQSPDDVRLLKDRDVIYRGYCPLKDKRIVKMWNGVSQSSFTGSLINNFDEKLALALREVLKNNYHQSKIKRTLWGIIDCLSSWKFMAPVTVFLGLLMTAIQTYVVLYTFRA